MKNIARLLSARKGSRLNGLYVTFLILVPVIISASGCEEEMATGQGASVMPKATDVNDIQVQALQTVQQSLSDPDPMLRTNAIEVVVETRQIRLIPRVQRLLGDDIVPVRFAAALAVGDLEYSFGISSLQQSLRDANPNVKMAASYSMSKLGNPEYAEVLLKGLASNDQTVRANAALLLGKTGDKSAIKHLYRALTDKSSDDKVVYQAAESIARLGDEWIYPKLWAMLISAYADVRMMGIRAMGALATRDAKNALATMLDDQVLDVRLAAAGQLGKLGDTAGETLVLDAIRQNLAAAIDEKGREQANVLTAMAIGQIGTPALREYLPRFMTDQSKFVRLAAARSVLMQKTRKD